MTELEAIAASVAKALGLRDLGSLSWADECAYHLHKNGDNLFDSHWQVRCRDRLLEYGWNVLTRTSTKNEAWKIGGEVIIVTCHPSEFCARAIHELMKGK